MKSLVFPKNKKGILMGNVIFIILNIVFAALLFYYVMDNASGTGMKQKVLAKEIASFIDAAEPGTVVELDIAAYKSIADSNKIKDFIQIADGQVKVVLRAGNGYTASYFSDNKLDVKYDANFIRMEVSA
jgi:hypothetical protein